MCHKTDFGRAPHGRTEALPPETEALPQFDVVGLDLPTGLDSDSDTPSDIAPGP